MTSVATPRLLFITQPSVGISVRQLSFNTSMRTCGSVQHWRPSYAKRTWLTNQSLRSHWSISLPNINGNKVLRAAHPAYREKVEERLDSRKFRDAWNGVQPIINFKHPSRNVDTDDWIL